MTNTNKKTMKKKLISAIAMLTVSAVTLSTATYAWFTMNKEVSVVGMQMKAHAEEGLLINEVADADDGNWDEQAKAGDSEFVALRPASTFDLSHWWHANSLKNDLEAGIGGSGSVETANTAKIGDDYYANISSGTVSVDNRTSTAGSVAERNIFFKDASFGSGSGTLDDGEGFYVMYKYYLKSSSNDGMTVDKSKFMITANAVKNGGGSGTDLDKAIRVAVKFADYDDYLIFAPTGGQTTYKVTKDVAGSDSDTVTAYTSETALNAFSASTGSIDIPAVTDDGMEVDVYVWFEGEDQDCKSSNLTENLNEYTIDLKFRIADIY